MKRVAEFLVAGIGNLIFTAVIIAVLLVCAIPWPFILLIETVFGIAGARRWSWQQRFVGGIAAALTIAMLPLARWMWHQGYALLSWVPISSAAVIFTAAYLLASAGMFKLADKFDAR